MLFNNVKKQQIIFLNIMNFPFNMYFFLNREDNMLGLKNALEDLLHREISEAVSV